MFKALKAKFIATFCYTLIVPEYKGFHVTCSLEEYWHWRMQYPADTRTYTTTPRWKIGKLRLLTGAQVW